MHAVHHKHILLLLRIVHVETTASRQMMVHVARGGASTAGNNLRLPGGGPPGEVLHHGPEVGRVRVEEGGRGPP